MESQNENSRQTPQNLQGNIWGWKFSAFSFILIAVLAYIAFVIGEGPGAVQPLPEGPAKVTGTTEPPDTIADSLKTNAPPQNSNR